MPYYPSVTNDRLWKLNMGRRCFTLPWPDGEINIQDRYHLLGLYPVGVSLELEIAKPINLDVQLPGVVDLSVEM